MLKYEVHISHLVLFVASQTERIELEKMNAQLKQQVTYFKEEINKMGEDRFKKV